jgi:hypothetical protein
LFVDGVDKTWLTKSAVGDIIWNMDVDDFKTVASGKGVADDVIREISRTVRDAEKEDGFYIGEVEVIPIPGKGVYTTLMEIEPVPLGRLPRLLLRMNEHAFAGRTLAELDDRVARSKNIVSNSLKEAVWHEIGHAKLINRKSIEEIQELYAELKPLGLPEISLIAGIDGAEAIAEIEVLLRRGESVSRDAMELYQKYMKRGLR